ncbi:hypothetical protein FK531_21185 [Rhodococcus spelaei]|uniref:Uncharacterized protein n=1 Tax=Rhodococcus spelaei TaxID=2546320 RepID=A0A541B008_9NOCA|nr:hypothetical protein FK531_21185 [Rhodococcus spelaei]
MGTLLAAGLLWPAPLAAAAPATSQPAGCVPFGTAQLPPGAPSAGGRAGLTTLPPFTGAAAPASVEIRTPTTQFNRFWDFTLVGHDLLTRPRNTGVPTTEPWRYVPMPECLRGRLVGISLDDDELVAVDDNGWIYTMDNASQHPLLWNWTSAWGAPLWIGPGRQLPGDRPNGWALSVSSPWDNQTYTDIAGRIHFIGFGKMTMLPALTGDGSRITYADPWLPNDDSYEIGGPLGGRFRADSLSAAGSTTFVMNNYGDMYTRTFDFDSSGSDSIFFRYSWDDQAGKPTAPNLVVETLDRSTAAIQLPAPDWVHQPKVPGEITSAISVHSLGPGPNRRELRVEGRRDGESGFWHKDLVGGTWEFTPTAAATLGTPIDNSPADRSSDTLAPPAPWHLSTTLPARDGAVDGQTLIDIGFPYTVVDPRLLDAVGQHAQPSGYRLQVDHFDPAATSRPATVRAPDGTDIPVVLHTADGLRMTPRGPELDDNPRHLVGAIEIPADILASRESTPALDAFVRDWMRGKHIAAITLSATDHDLVVR